MPCSVKTGHHIQRLHLCVPNHCRNTPHLPSIGVHARHQDSAALLLTLCNFPHQLMCTSPQSLNYWLAGCTAPCTSPQRSLLVRDHGRCHTPAAVQQQHTRCIEYSQAADNMWHMYCLHQTLHSTGQLALSTHHQLSIHVSTRWCSVARNKAAAASC